MIREQSETVASAREARFKKVKQVKFFMTLGLRTLKWKTDNDKINFVLLLCILFGIYGTILVSNIMLWNLIHEFISKKHVYAFWRLAEIIIILKPSKFFIYRIISMLSIIVFENHKTPNGERWIISEIKHRWRCELA